MLDGASVKLSRLWRDVRQSHIKVVISAKLADFFGDTSQAHHNAHSSRLRTRIQEVSFAN